MYRRIHSEEGRGCHGRRKACLTWSDRTAQVARLDDSSPTYRPLVRDRDAGRSVPFRQMMESLRSFVLGALVDPSYPSESSSSQLHALPILNPQSSDDRMPDGNMRPTGQPKLLPTLPSAAAPFNGPTSFLPEPRGSSSFRPAVADLASPLTPHRMLDAANVAANPPRRCVPAMISRILETQSEPCVRF